MKYYLLDSGVELDWFLDRAAIHKLVPPAVHNVIDQSNSWRMKE